MKIIIINNLYGAFSRGGTEKVIEKIVFGLEKNHHNVKIIATKPYRSKVIKSEKIFYINSLYSYLGRLPLFIRLFLHFYNLFDYITVKKIEKIINSEKPDMVISNNLVGLSFLIPRLIKKKKIKHVHILHDIQLLHPSGIMIFGQENEIDSLIARVYRKIISFLFFDTDIIISPSKWLADIHKQEGLFVNKKIEILPNPINFSGQINMNKDFYPENLKLLFVGQVVKHKGIIFFIKFFKKIIKEDRYKNLKLFIVGDGADLKISQNEAGDKENIIFMGRKNSFEINELMGKCDLLIVPSLCYENSPTVIYEAVTAGLPVIASNIGGISELINYFGGFLFKPGSEESFFEILNEIIQDPEKIKNICINYHQKINDYNLNNYIKKLNNLISN